MKKNAKKKKSQRVKPGEAQRKLAVLLASHEGLEIHLHRLNDEAATRRQQIEAIVGSLNSVTNQLERTKKLLDEVLGLSKAPASSPSQYTSDPWERIKYPSADFLCSTSAHSGGSSAATYRYRDSGRCDRCVKIRPLTARSRQELAAGRIPS